MVFNRKSHDKAFSPRKGVRKMQPPVTSPSSHIKVFVRARPFNHRENVINCKEVVRICDETTLLFDPQEEEDVFFFRGVQQQGRDLTKKMKKNMLLEFDRVFGDEASNDQVYEETTKDIVSSVFEGYNCSIFAYGATGAGKTFTMLGNQHQPGITYLTIVELLNYIDENRDQMDVTLGASYIEVYNENVRDLLKPTALALHLRDTGGRVAIAGLKVEQIKDRERLFSLLESGNRNRSQHPTDSNEESSRSHAIFQVHVRIVLKGSGEVKLSKLSMIDLAGSERGAATGCSGIRFKEGSNINKSLLALGNCINALADGLRHVPYRDSKLTRILKDSLGGNCRTVMVANVSPSSASYEDTYNTLKYAHRARTIKSKLTKNVLHETMTVHQYKKLVEQLTAKIAKAEAEGGMAPDLDEWTKEIDGLMGEKRRLCETILTLEGEKKIIEWRLKNKGLRLAQLVGDETMDGDMVCVTRMNIGMDQLRARASSILVRKEELERETHALGPREKSLRERIEASPFAKILTKFMDNWDAELRCMEAKMESTHRDKLLMLELRELESRRAVEEQFVPLCKEQHTLLRAHSHLTNALRDKFQMAMRSLEGVKSVSWEFGEVEGGASEEVGGEERRVLSRLTSCSQPPPRPPTPTPRTRFPLEPLSAQLDEHFPKRQRINPPLPKTPGSRGTLALRTGNGMSKITFNKENHGPIVMKSKPQVYGGSSFNSALKRSHKVTLGINGVPVKPVQVKSPGFDQKQNLYNKKLVVNAAPRFRTQ